MGELEGMNRSRLGGSTGFRMYGWEDVFIKFVASELGRCEEGSEDIDKIGPGLVIFIVSDEISLEKSTTHSSPRRNSAVSAKCSRESDEERTPP